MIAEAVRLPESPDEIGDVTIMDSRRRVVAKLTAGEFRRVHPITTCKRHNRNWCLACGDRSSFVFKPGREIERLPWRASR